MRRQDMSCQCQNCPLHPWLHRSSTDQITHKAGKFGLVRQIGRKYLNFPFEHRSLMIKKRSRSSGPPFQSEKFRLSCLWSWLMIEHTFLFFFKVNCSLLSVATSLVPSSDGSIPKPRAYFMHRDRSVSRLKKHHMTVIIPHERRFQRRRTGLKATI